MFTVTIIVGNSAMQTPDQVAIALRELADRLTDRGDFYAHETGLIRDYNRNTVGRWAFDA